MPDIREFKPKDAAAKAEALQRVEEACEELKLYDNLCAFQFTDEGTLVMNVLNMQTSEIVFALERIKLQVLIDSE